MERRFDRVAANSFRARLASELERWQTAITACHCQGCHAAHRGGRVAKIPGPFGVGRRCETEVGRTRLGETQVGRTRLGVETCCYRVESSVPWDAGSPAAAGIRRPRSFQDQNLRVAEIPMVRGWMVSSACGSWEELIAEICARLSVRLRANAVTLHSSLISPSRNASVV